MSFEIKNVGTGIALAGFFIALAIYFSSSESSYHRYQYKKAGRIFDSHTGTIYELIEGNVAHAWREIKLNGEIIVNEFSHIGKSKLNSPKKSAFSEKVDKCMEQMPTSVSSDEFLDQLELCHKKLSKN